MTVSYIGATSAESTSVALHTHQAGDLIVVAAMRYGNLSGPTIPAGWGYRYINQRAGSLASLSVAIAYRIATSSAETSGTWTNATHLLAAVYRDDANYLALGCPVYNRATGTGVNYSAKTVSTSHNGIGSMGGLMAVASGWVLGIGLAHLNTAGIDTPPSGMTHRHMLTGATQGRLAIADTDAAVSSFTAASTTVAASTDWITNVVEIIDTGSVKAAGGGGLLVHPGMSGGMRG